MEEKKKTNIGGIWQNKTQKGDEKLGIKVEIDGIVYNFTALKNQFKEDGDNKPDWNILPKREDSNYQPRQAEAKSQTQEPAHTAESVASDVPF